MHMSISAEPNLISSALGPIMHLCINGCCCRRKLLWWRLTAVWVYGYKHKDLEGNFTRCAFSKITIACFALGPVTSSEVCFCFLSLLFCFVFGQEDSTRRMTREEAATHSRCTSDCARGRPCLADWCCSMQRPELGKSIDVFSPLARETWILNCLHFSFLFIPEMCVESS